MTNKIRQAREDARVKEAPMLTELRRFVEVHWPWCVGAFTVCLLGLTALTVYVLAMGPPPPA